MGRALRRKSYLLIRIHACKSASVAGFTTLLRNLRYFFLGTVGEVARIGVVG